MDTAALGFSGSSDCLHDIRSRRRVPAMYIGIGTVVVILLIILAIFIIRRL